MRAVAWKCPYPTAPLVASVLVHAALLVALWTLAVPQQTLAPRQRARTITLLAVVPARARVAPAVRPAMPHEWRRPFQPPTVLAAPLREIVAAPLIDIPRPLLASPDARPIAILPPPPLKTNNLAPPVVAARVADAPAVVRPAGFSGAISATPGLAGTLRHSGFESASTGDTPPPPRLLAASGFGDATIAAAPSVTAGAAVSPVTRAVEILSKPKPVYTGEARARRIEGEVLLRVLFAASGQVHVLATVRGLGYGLDDNAVAAAEAIRFRPAERAGAVVDSTAIVHIVFQLAY